MIIKDEDALKRLNSPMNLINKLKSSSNRKSAMSLFGIGVKKEEPKKELLKAEDVLFNPFIKAASNPGPSAALALPEQPQTSLDNILENHESQIKLGLAHDKALDLLTNSVTILASKLDDVRADKMPSVVMAASKVVESIRRERNEASKNNKDREVHYHFYTPEQRKVEDYQIIDVGVESVS